MATKLLNLDEFGGSETLTIVLNGTEHKLQEMTVADFIWAQKEMKRQESMQDEVAVF
jgi:sulfur carrier protein ThiS